MIVQDADHRPVQGAVVTFTVSAGGGTFEGGGITYTVVSNGNGLAEASFVLGQHTEDNPTFRLDDGDTYTQQVGENIIDAELSTRLRGRSQHLIKWRVGRTVF